LVWLALSGGFRVVPLAFFIEVAIAVLIIVALGEVFILLILQVGPSLHHVPKLYGGSWAVDSEVAVDVL
jgi:hypothetical protein